MKKSKLFLILVFILSLVSCRNDFLDSEIANSEIEDEIQEVIIGDEIIYGECFSFQDIYDEAFDNLENATRQLIARSATADESSITEFSETDFEKMVYFSVLPTTIESVKIINTMMGYLNPTEMDKELIQSCDAEKLIFKNDVVITDDTIVEEAVNFDVKYYYITTKDEADILSTMLEGFEIIEEFETLTDEALLRLQTECEELLIDYEDDESRGIFSIIGNAIKKAVNAVKSFIVTKHDIKGTLYYEVDEIKVPAYGINISNVCIGGNDDDTNKSGEFSLGSRTDAQGLCFLWLNYENDACKLSNMLGITASTLVKTDWPSKLKNVKITTSSDYANAKMSVCSDLLKRYDDELTRHTNIPKAIVWSTELGDGVSSAPCFRYLGFEKLPDIILTGLSADSINSLQTLHHEYTHFLHCVYTKNKNTFWDKVVLSEIGCTIATAALNVLDYFFEDDLNSPYVAGTYNFENPYVCFAENLAGWYSFVGCYGQGDVGKMQEDYYGYGHYSNTEIYDNSDVFAKLISKFYSNATTTQKQKLAFEFINLIDLYDITTFAEFYDVLIKKYPSKKSYIQSVFKTYYKQYGSKDGNVINY